MWPTPVLPARSAASASASASSRLASRPARLLTVRPPAPSSSATPDELQTFLKDYVSKIELPKQIEIRDALPKTAVGKLSKKELVAEESAKAPAAAA